MRLTNSQIYAAFTSDGDRDWEDIEPETLPELTPIVRQFPQFVNGIFCVDHGYGLVCAACAGYGGQWGHVTDFSQPMWIKLDFIPCNVCKDGQPTLLLGYTPLSEQNFPQNKQSCFSVVEGEYHPECRACHGFGFSYGSYYDDVTFEPKYGSITCPECKGNMSAPWSFQVVSRGI